VKSEPAARAPGRRTGLGAFCDAVDLTNEWVGRLLGPMIVFVSAAIVYEIVSRGVFSVGSIWVSEAVVYGAAAVYLLAGGYALLHRRHVRIDMLFGMLSPRTIRVLDLIALPFLLGYGLTLVVVGGEIAWTSFVQAEGTGTPWNPRIWPVKACIPLAGALLMAQAVANTLRDTGLVRATSGSP
jgi:TRAP-type mannitol/chloroaromatic compound transport system permease small subunit